MRKIRLLVIIIIAASALLLAACGSTGTSVELGGTTWQLVSYGPTSNQTPAAAGVETNLAFGTDGKISGSLGCNGFSGAYTLKADKITFGNIASTLIACAEPQMTQESSAFQVLSGTVAYSIKDGSLTITSADGASALMFSRK